MQKSIRHEFVFAQPPAIVWEYLTDPVLLAQWLMPNDFKPIKRHAFQFKARPNAKFSFDGTVYCKVLEIVPCKKLVYSWKGGMSKENPSLDSIVTWTLSAKEDQTVLLLGHSGFKGLKNYLAYFIMNMGWAKIGKRLSVKLNPAVYGKSTA